MRVGVNVVLNCRDAPVTRFLLYSIDVCHDLYMLLKFLRGKGVFVVLFHF